MAIDAFLVLTDMSNKVLPGETQDQYFGQSKFNATELSSYSFGIHNTTTIGSQSSGAGGGKAQFTEFKIRKVVDSISRDLLLYAGGADPYKYLKQLDLYLRKAGGSSNGGAHPNAGFLKYSFKLVYVTDSEWSGSASDDNVIEDVTFVYGAMQLVYTAQTASGQSGTTYTGAWSQVTNSNDFNDPRLG